MLTYSLSPHKYCLLLGISKLLAFLLFPFLLSVSCLLQLGEGLPAVHFFIGNREVTYLHPHSITATLPVVGVRIYLQFNS